MNNTLIIYDDLGYIIFQGQGFREPNGVPFLWVEIPDGKQIKITNGIGVDVSVTPNVAIFEDIPKTELEIANERILSTENAINAIMGML